MQSFPARGLASRLHRVTGWALSGSASFGAGSMDANAARENRCQESEDVMRAVRGERAAPSARAACPGDAPALEIPNPLCLIGPGGKFRTAWLPGPTPFERESSEQGSSGTGSSGTEPSGTGSSGTGSSGTGSADDSAANHHAGGCREKRKHPPRPRANCRDRRGPRLRCSPNQGRVRVLTPARVGLLGVGAPRDGSWASPGGHMSTGHMSTEHMSTGAYEHGAYDRGGFHVRQAPCHLQAAPDQQGRRAASLGHHWVWISGRASTVG
jgi:hypothetical protein